MYPKRHRDAAPKCGSPPPHRIGATRSGHVDKGVGPPNSNVTMYHPISNRIQWPHHTVGSATISPPLTQCAQHNRSTIGFHPNLCRTQYLPPKLLLLSPPTGTHIENTRPRHTHRAVPRPHTSSIGRTHECTVVHGAGPGPLDNNT